MEDTEITRLFFKGRWILAYFSHANWHDLAIFWEMLENQTFQKAHKTLSKHAKIHINSETHYEKNSLFKEMKNLHSFGGSFYKPKIADILNF